MDWGIWRSAGLSQSHCVPQMHHHLFFFTSPDPHTPSWLTTPLLLRHLQCHCPWSGARLGSQPGWASVLTATTQPWQSHLSFLGIHFHICSMVFTPPPLQGGCKEEMTSHRPKCHISTGHEKMPVLFLPLLFLYPYPELLCPLSHS